jgi:NAD(P)H dehydrogenase (quinone)
LTCNNIFLEVKKISPLPDRQPLRSVWRRAHLVVDPAATLRQLDYPTGRGTINQGERGTMKVAIIYHSETGNVREMAELVRQGCLRIPNVEAMTMPVDETDEAFLAESAAVILGSPTYEGSCSWQMKKFLDTGPTGLAGKLGGVFVSQNWPGGGGGSFAEMTLIAGMLVHGMVIYSGGIAEGSPYLHFGAVSQKAPDEDIYRDRCLKLGHNIAAKAVELFGEAGAR